MPRDTGRKAGGNNFRNRKSCSFSKINKKCRARTLGKGAREKGRHREMKVKSARLMPPILICKQISAEFSFVISLGPEGLKGKPGDTGAAGKQLYHTNVLENKIKIYF